MLKTVPLVTAVVAVAIGLLVAWSNPKRLVNQVVATCCGHVAVWLLFLFFVVNLQNGLFALRVMCAVAAFFPMHIGVLELSIAYGSLQAAPRWRRRCAGWFAYSLVLAWVCFTRFFIRSESTPAHRLYDWGYYVYIAGALAGYAYVFFRMLADIRRVDGVRRLELEVWLLGGCFAAAAIPVMIWLKANSHSLGYVQMQPIFILLFMGGTAYTITTHRLFDVGQILRLLVHRAVLVLLCSAEAFGVFWMAEKVAPRPVAFVVAIGVLTIFFGPVRRWLDRHFGYYQQESIARNAAFDVARKEVRLEHLQEEFRNILKGFGLAEQAIVLSGANAWLSGCGVQVGGDEPEIVTLRELGWATPERLIRERESPGRKALARFLDEQQLGVALIVQGPSVSVLTGLGRSATRRPYNYQQVKQLRELSSIFQGPLERAHIASKMQHTEQLATMGLLGASIAHEIRNPLVSLKAVVQLLPAHHGEKEFQDKFFTLMIDEVKRIDRLTEQLLDLASPRAYTTQPIRLHAAVQSGLELVTPRAKDTGIPIEAHLQAQPDEILCDPSAVKQVIINLCLNAIQILDGWDGPRFIRVATQNWPGHIDLTVTDSGPGIDPTMRGRLFQAFQSTKSSGFGLGLVVCRDILASLNATIIVDPPQPGEGATFRVSFPCRL